MAVCGMLAVYEVVRAHDRFRLGLFYGNLEALQENFTGSTFADVGVHMVSVVLLIVKGKMLDRSTGTLMFLYSLCICSSRTSGNQWILGIIFEVTSAEWIPVDIHTRCQPEVNTELFHLTADNVSGILNGCYIPGLCQKCGDRDGGCILIIGFGISRHFLFIKSHKCIECFQTGTAWQYVIVCIGLKGLCKPQTGRSVC